MATSTSPREPLPRIGEVSVPVKPTTGSVIARELLELDH
ncbi:hypothetical protein NSERUTF1_3889 [Nocardia seriolae]|nr:hypothetical protein NSERUTF1_3889 [Nocardia seriolae]